MATSITASISGSENIDDDLTRIIERLTDLLADTSHGPNVPLIDIVMRRLAELRKKQIELVYVEKGSILLFYFCKSLVALHCLHDWYISEQLKEMMQEIFLALLNTRDVGGLHITTMQWRSPDYTSCVRSLRDHEEILNKMHS